MASALSLDFFLTEPYLRLEIADKHDLIAFFGLAGLRPARSADARLAARRATALSAGRSGRGRR